MSNRLTSLVASRARAESLRLTGNKNMRRRGSRIWLGRVLQPTVRGPNETRCSGASCGPGTVSPSAHPAPPWSHMQRPVVLNGIALREPVPVLSANAWLAEQRQTRPSPARRPQPTSNAPSAIARLFGAQRGFPSRPAAARTYGQTGARPVEVLAHPTCVWSTSISGLGI